MRVDKAEAYLVERSSRPYEPIVADADAHYAQTIYVDGASIVPMVACPHEVDNMMENVTKRVCQIHSRAEPLGKAE